VETRNFVKGRSKLPGDQVIFGANFRLAIKALEPKDLIQEGKVKHFGLTYWASLSRKRCKRPMWPIERRELPSLSLLSFPAGPVMSVERLVIVC